MLLILQHGIRCSRCTLIDVYEESEADLIYERNNNDLTNYRSTKSRSPDVTFSIGTKTDRKLSSGYFVLCKIVLFAMHFHPLR